jgi:hypothetical protein
MVILVNFNPAVLTDKLDLITRPTLRKMLQLQSCKWKLLLLYLGLWTADLGLKAEVKAPFFATF